MAKVQFSKLRLEDGRPVEYDIRAVDPYVCPHVILVSEHYNEDGTCKCRDPNEKIMRTWGYRWSKKLNQWA